MSARPSETFEVHTRLQKCTLEVESSREYWARIGLGETPTAQVAFDECWFGARSFERTAEILAHLRARFDPYPEALQVLAGWPHMGPDIRRLICHWHLQLSDPLYRAFTGSFLVERQRGTRAQVTRDLVTAWVDAEHPGRWSLTTRIQFASKLLSTAASAGLVDGKRDPRPLLYPRVADAALAYVVYLLRSVDYAGTLLANPYLASVGLEGKELEDRLRRLDGLRFSRQGDLVDLDWSHPSIIAWAAHSLGAGGGVSRANPAANARAIP